MHVTEWDENERGFIFAVSDDSTTLHIEHRLDGTWHTLDSEFRPVSTDEGAVQVVLAYETRHAASFARHSLSCQPGPAHWLYA